MTRAQRILTLPTFREPAVVEIDNRRLSGAHWHAEFRGSETFDEHMSEPFSTNAQAFIAALRSAGAHVVITSTYRPSNRAFLMHWSWKIARSKADPRKIPRREGVNIRWDHMDADGNYSSKKSISAAAAMVRAYGTGHLAKPPALNTKHTEGNAVDMLISWQNTLSIQQADGTDILINTEPRTGMNARLRKVGASYKVIKFLGGYKDVPHWSTNGH